jgi:hypothetical protein
MARGCGRDLVDHDLEEAERAGELAVDPLHEEVRDGAVRHPHLDHRPVVIPQELRRQLIGVLDVGLEGLDGVLEPPPHR